MSQMLLGLLALRQLLWKVCTPASPSRTSASRRGEANRKLSTQKCKDKNEEGAALLCIQTQAQVLDLKPPVFFFFLL